MAQAAIPLAIASTALSAGSSIMAGRSQAAALKTEAALNERQAKDVDLQAMQASERRREELNATVAAFVANRAARGLSLDSPTGVAIERVLRRQSVRGEGVERLGYLNQGYAMRAGAAAKRKAATNANRMGYINAAGTIMSGAGDVAGASGGGSRRAPSGQMAGGGVY